MWHRGERGPIQWAFIVALVASCSGRCGSSRPEVHADLAPPTSASAAQTVPAADATPLDAEARADVDSDGDAHCPTAGDDAHARFRAWCEANPDDCMHPDEAFGNGTREPDLDGDGIPEVSWGWGPPSVDVETHLYAGKPGCAVHLATLPGNSSVHALPTRHEGHADVRAEDTTICEGACHCTPDVSVYVFANGEYHEDPTRHVKGTFTPCVAPP